MAGRPSKVKLPKNFAAKPLFPGAPQPGNPVVARLPTRTELRQKAREEREAEAVDLEAESDSDDESSDEEGESDSESQSGSESGSESEARSVKARPKNPRKAKKPKKADKTRKRREGPRPFKEAWVLKYPWLEKLTKVIISSASFRIVLEGLQYIIPK